MEIKSTAKFQIVEDSKQEPDLETAQKFVGGMVEGITFQMVIIIINKKAS